MDYPLVTLSVLILEVLYLHAQGIISNQNMRILVQYQKLLVFLIQLLV